VGGCALNRYRKGKPKEEGKRTALHLYKRVRLGVRTAGERTGRGKNPNTGREECILHFKCSKKRNARGGEDSPGLMLFFFNELWGKILQKPDLASGHNLDGGKRTERGKKDTAQAAKPGEL